VHIGLAQLGSDLVLPDFGFGFLACLLLGILSDHGDRLGNIADLIAAICTRNNHVEFACGHLAHCTT
jgi:hypothetical protein